MIAIDLDGTLLCPGGTVKPRVRQAVRSVLDVGSVVCFATGRSFNESRAVLEAVGHFDSAVFVGGAMVMDTHRRVTLHRMGMQRELAADISRSLEQLGHAVLALQDHPEIDYLASASPAVDPATDAWMKMHGVRMKFVPRLSEADHSHTIRLGIVADNHGLSEACNMLNKNFAERVMFQTLGVFANTRVLEIFDPGVNKWEGISHVAKRYSIAAHEIIAVGDEVNDLPMIRRAGLGVAMGNAHPEVLKAAKRVIGPNHQEGLAEFIEHMVAGGAFAPPDRPTGDEAAA
jgi:Cof subfamily protein (haloacid dehalogenase superfamily)